MRFSKILFGIIVVSLLFYTMAGAQMYSTGDYYQNPSSDWPDDVAAEWYANAQPGQPGQPYSQGNPPTGNPHYGRRILRDQMARVMDSTRAQQARNEMYDAYFDQPTPTEAQVQSVLAEAQYVGSLIREKNGKPFIVIDKRNFQFYLYNSVGSLLRIGPVAIGKGKKRIGDFETPEGIYPIKSKEPVADWIRPDWYFIEEGEPIPKNWEDRRVPGFFRYKLVFLGMRYIHYAEATGGRLTHGCLGLDWQDAEAVFHTLEVGSYCIIVNGGFLKRLASGEFPVHKPAQKKPPEGSAQLAKAESEKPSGKSSGPVFGSMW